MFVDLNLIKLVDVTITITQGMRHTPIPADLLQFIAIKNSHQKHNAEGVSFFINNCSVFR